MHGYLIEYHVFLIETVIFRITCNRFLIHNEIHRTYARAHMDIHLLEAMQYVDALFD